MFTWVGGLAAKPLKIGFVHMIRQERVDRLSARGYPEPCAVDVVDREPLRSGPVHDLVGRELHAAVDPADDAGLWIGRFQLLLAGFALEAEEGE